MKRKLTCLVVVGMLLMTLTGCFPHAEKADPGKKTQNEETHPDHNHAPTEIEPVEEWTSNLAEDAKSTAKEFAVAFSRPGIERAEWYAALKPYLSETAQDRYAEVSNVNIPSTTVESVGDAEQGLSPAICTVRVTTDTEILELLMSRSDNSWKIEKITSDPK
ncbi:UNVERIFIED_CONTAM: hypothetical protein Q9R71_35475 [Actinomycetes bacterium ARC8]|nr:hypothetical protein [Actinomycetes bacterium ARC8]